MFDWLRTFMSGETPPTRQDILTAAYLLLLIDASIEELETMQKRIDALLYVKRDRQRQEQARLPPL